jgi:hypothetical protein
MACLINPISQPSLVISPIWIPLISKEVANSQRSVGRDRIFMDLYTVLVSRVQILLQIWR